MRKIVSILQEGGLTTFLPTPPVISVVLLHKQDNRVILYFLQCIRKNLFQQTTNIPQTTVERTTKVRSLHENTKELTTESILDVENSTILVTNTTMQAKCITAEKKRQST